MTTKPKPRRAPAKATKAQPAPQAAPAKPARKISAAVRLVGRWRWLEADAMYQSAVAKTDEGSEKLIAVHIEEKRQIETELLDAVPEDFEDVRELLALAAEFALPGGANMIENLTATLIRNVDEALFALRRDELASEREKAIAEAEKDLARGVEFATTFRKAMDKARKVGAQS